MKQSHSFQTAAVRLQRYNPMATEGGTPQQHSNRMKPHILQNTGLTADSPEIIRRHVRQPPRTPSTAAHIPGAKGTLATVRAVQTLGISGDPPADNCNYQKTPRKEKKAQKPLALLATIQKNLGRQVLCLQLSFSRVLFAG